MSMVIALILKVANGLSISLSKQAFALLKATKNMFLPQNLTQ